MQTIQYTTVRDIALDTNGDWEVSNNDLQLIGDDEAILQSVNIRLQFFLGEWFIDQTAGVPWFQEILVKNPDPNQLQGIFQAAILATPGITAVNSLTLQYDVGVRNLVVNWAATGDSGQLIQSSVAQQI
jgi:hypothetical protein